MLSKKLSALIFVVVCSVTAVYAEGVVVSGTAMDKKSAAPIAKTAISVRVNGRTEKALTNAKGFFSLGVNVSGRFFVGTITASAKEYQTENKWLVFLPWTRSIKVDFKLRDITPPLLEILSPLEGEEIFSNPTIKLHYRDEGSGLDKRTLKVWVNGKNLTTSLKNTGAQSAVLTVSKKDSFSEGPCVISAQIADRAGNLQEIDVRARVVTKENYFVRLGKEALLNRDIVAANQNFKKALEVSPLGAEANFYYAITRLGVLPLDNNSLYLLEDMGFKAAKGKPLAKADLDPFHFNAQAPAGLGKFNLPSTFPKGEELQGVVRNKIIPELVGALKNLALVLKKKDFVSYLEAKNLLTGREKIEIDYADAAFLKSLLSLVKSRMQEALVRNLDSDLAYLSYLFVQGALKPEYVLEQYPQLLRVKDIPQSTAAKQALIEAIDSYLEGYNSLFAETDDQTDDLISLSKASVYRQQAKLFAQEISDIKKSLLGAPDSNFSLKISQMVNLGYYFDNPLDPMGVLDSDGVTYFLRGMLPYPTYALNNFSKADISYQELIPPTNIFYNGQKKEVDFADISLVKASLRSIRVFSLSMLGYNLNVNNKPLALDMLNRKKISFNDILNTYSDLFTLRSTSNIESARKSLVNLVNDYKDAVDYWVNREDRYPSDDIYLPGAYFWKNESRYASMLDGLKDMQATAIDIHPKYTHDNVRVNLGEFFLKYKDARQFIPKFDKDNRYIKGTFPDPTFWGILPDNKS